MSIASLTVDLTANLAKFEADMGKGAQIAVRFAEQSARAQSTFLRALERSSEKLGKTEADFLRVRAAELGASEAAEKFIGRLEAAGGAAQAVGTQGVAAFQNLSGTLDASLSRQKSTVNDLIAGIKAVNAETQRLRAQAIADEKAGSINPDQLKARLTNLGAGRTDAIQKLKDAAAAQEAAQKVADAEQAAAQKRAAQFENLRNTAARLAYESEQKQIAAAQAVADAEAATLAKRAAAFEKLRNDNSRRIFQDQREQAAAAQAAADAEAEGLAKRAEAFQRLRDSVSKLNYREQQSAAKQAAEEQKAAAAAAQKAADAQAASVARFVSSIEAEANAIGKTRAELLSLQAAQLGVADKLQPFLAKIKEAETNISKFGRQTGVSRYELLTLQYTVSDVVASLASGISPMTILLQQGGQVRDVFGSFGRVFQAVGSLITPFRLAVGATAAALGALAYAFYEGSQQSKAFRDALSLTGNFAGQTEGQFNATARAIAASGEVSIRVAREFGTALANTGQVGPDVFAQATEAAARFGAATGKNAKEVADDFASMGEDVAKWAADHNKQLNFVTAAQLEHIRRLQEQGKAVEAQKIVYEALNERLRSLEPNLGTLDRVLRAVKGAWNEFWDSAFDVGRADTIEQKIARARAAVANGLGEERVSQTQLDPERRAQLAKERSNDVQGENLRLLLRSQGAQQATAAYNAETAAVNKSADAAKKWAEDHLKAAHSATGLSNALAEMNAKFAAEDKAFARDSSFTRTSAADRKLIEKQIRESFQDKKGIGDADAVRKALLAQDLKFVEEKLAREKDALAFQQTELSALYQLGNVSLASYYERKRQIIQEGIDKELNAIVDEQARLEVELERGAFKDPQQRIDVQTKLNESAAKAAKIQTEGARAIQLSNIEQANSFKQLNDRILEYRAQLLQLQGDELGAARERAKVAIGNARLFQAQSGGAITDDDIRKQERATEIADLFAEAQRRAARATQTAQIAEESFLLRATKNGATLVEQERGVYAIRATALVQLGELVQKTQQLADETDDPRLKLAAAELALQYQKAAEAVDPALNRLRQAGSDLASGLASSIASGIENMRSLNDVALDLSKTLLRISTQTLIKEPLEVAFRNAIKGATEGDNPIGNFFKNVLGIQSGAMQSAQSAQIGATVQSTSSLTYLTFAAQQAASALAAVAASAGYGSSGSGFGGFAGLLGSGYGSTGSATFGGGYGDTIYTGGFGLFHTGGMVGHGGSTIRQAPLSLLSGARRYHGGGLARDEVPAILQVGERVLTAQQQRQWGRGGGGNVYVTHSGPTTVDAQRDSNGDWQIFVEVAAEKGAQRGQQRTAADIRSGTGPNAYALKGRGVPLNRNLPRRT